MPHRHAALLCLLVGVTTSVVLLLPGGRCLGASQGEYATDLAAFFKEVDATYPFFDLKGIGGDWQNAKKRLVLGLRSCRTDSQFLGLLVEAMRALRDGHMGLEDPKAEIPPPPKEYYPGVSFLPGIKNSVLVMYPPKGLESQLATGTPVVTIDGKPARKVLDARTQQAWAEGGYFSSPQRARLFEYRIPLRGKEGERHVLGVLDGRKIKQVTLTSNQEVRGWPHTYNMPENLQRVGRSFWYTRLPTGAGYMYIRRVDDSTVPGMKEALEKGSAARGWVVDLCGNGGGGYDETLINTIKAMPRPVAVVIDAGCISAGETLARDFRRYAGARLFGSKTAGSSTSKKHWPLPSGLATVRISVRSRWRSDRKPIEFNGIDPDVPVEADPAEVTRGLNSAIVRAQAYLASQAK
jgi:hypothetical protein